MRVEQIWRYPVKSMAGERLASARLRADGIEGDRMLVAADPAGRIHTSRRYARLLGFHATLGPDGEPLVDGRPWHDDAVQAAVADATERGVRLERRDDLRRFDILPLLVITDGAVAAFGRDVRRLRPNLVIGGVEGLAEREWEGRRLQVGETVLRLDSLRGRCIMTTFDPDTLKQDVYVLRDIAERLGGVLGLNTAVERGGTIREGDPVALLD